MFDAFDIPAHVLRFMFGLAGGVILGAAGRQGRFCTLGAIEDAVYGADWTRLRAWAFAAACAIVYTQVIAVTGLLDLQRSIYWAGEIGWFGAIVGGLMFGFGMALVGTCGYGTLLRMGGGDLRAVVTFLVIAVSAYATMRGLPGLGRVLVIEPLRLDASILGGPSILRPGREWLSAGIVIALVGGLLAFSFWKGALLRQPRLLVATLVIGMTVVFGWWATGIVGDDPFEPGRVESFSFVAPLGETLVYFMTASAATVDFMEGSVLGVTAGAFMAAVQSKEFYWEAYDDSREMKRHLAGAALMGTGGVTALGCTIGQGLTGISTLSLGSFLATGMIFLGARVGLYWLVERGTP